MDYQLLVFMANLAANVAARVLAHIIIVRIPPPDEESGTSSGHAKAPRGHSPRHFPKG